MPPRAKGGSTNGVGSAPSSSLKITVNGLPIDTPCPPERILLDLLREDLELTGTKRGCDLGTCGCCTVLVDGRPTLSCLTLARLVERRTITTIEGLTPAQGLSTLQRAFVEHGATQCGFCTPGFLVTASALLEERPNPSRSEIIDAISGNLCRCTGYTKIIEAIEAAAREGR
ncbi:MAG: (2Fe-2S)-binding protein [Thermoplasmata archaeon]|jgi:aerobic-type carbon monoxide dehydrogenase small subunit (CoxS/CutS family)|nr:(2Fe-2S)-binding protein [Thermoplasmata archaeon]